MISSRLDVCRCIYWDIYDGDKQVGDDIDKKRLRVCSYLHSMPLYSSTEALRPVASMLHVLVLIELLFVLYSIPLHGGFYLQ